MRPALESRPPLPPRAASGAFPIRSTLHRGNASLEPWRAAGERPSAAAPASPEPPVRQVPPTMGSIQTIARRVADFLPYTLPLWLISVVPFITPDQTLRLAVYATAAFTVPMVMDYVGGAERSHRLAMDSDAAPRAEYEWLVRLLFLKLIAIQVLMFLV